MVKKKMPSTKQVQPNKATDRGQKSDKMPIVGIGASAGGLEALEGLFACLPADLKAAFVIIQHLDPKRKSLMDELLQKYTHLKVSQIEDGHQIEPNCIYLNPPNYYVGLFNGTFFLTAPQKGMGIGQPIDYFFRSLADDINTKAIAIILSGTGTDGTLGIRAIKEQGGMVIVQEEAQAAFAGMPASAIETGLVDLVLKVEKIGPELLNYLDHPYMADRQKSVVDESFETFLIKILHLIRTSTGNDFSGYKQNTIRRRIGRRMALHQINTINEYYRYVERTPAEIDILFKDLLIGVTNFFRDPKAWQVLQKIILPDLIKSKPSKASIRIWVPGCATGEEAYSLAILLVEGMEKMNSHTDVQIFATDIDEDAIVFARQGVFTDNIAADVSRQRLRRFFVKNGKTYEVSKQIRDMIVFAVQNLINDPPFSRLDLVSCRNLLIYMDPELQKQILPLFHFTLRSEGILLLGNSESIGGFADLFTPIDTKWKIFKRKDVLLEKMAEYPMPPLVDAGGTNTPPVKKLVPKISNIRSIAEKLILDQYAPASVLINAKLNILYYIGDTGRYLQQPSGEPAINILKMIHKDLRYKLSLVLKNAIKSKKQIVTRGLQFQAKGDVKTVNITVNPLNEPTLPEGLMMVVFEAQSPPGLADAKKPGKAGKKTKLDDDPVDTRIKSLEQELKYTRENLQTTIEELETSNEELKSTNEELQSTNEELQSTNEELETSKEEMHSTNEELVTINAELQHKVKELEDVNNDISNLLASTEIATMFLDYDLRIRRYTPPTTSLFNLIGSDVGRPIGDITARIDYDDFQRDARRVLNKLVPIEKEVHTGDGRSIAIRIIPYRTVENKIDGLVVTFVDVTERKRALDKAQQARRYVENILDTIVEPLVVLDKDLKVVSATRSFYAKFKLQSSDIEKTAFFNLCQGAWDIPDLRKAIEEVLPRHNYLENFSLECDLPEIGLKKLTLNGRMVFSPEGEEPSLILLSINDTST